MNKAKKFDIITALGKRFVSMSFLHVSPIVTFGDRYSRNPVVAWAMPTKIAAQSKWWA